MATEQTKELSDRIFRLNKLIFNKLEHMTENSHGTLKMLAVVDREVKVLKNQQENVPGVTVSKLSTCLMHSKPATSKMLNSLEEKGYIERITTKADRRAVYVVLTELGQMTLERHYQALDVYTTEVLHQLGTEDTAHLMRILDRIYNIIEEK